MNEFDGGRGRGGQNEVCGFGEKGIGGLNGVVDQGRDGFSKVWDINPGSLALPNSRVDEGNGGCPSDVLGKDWDSIGTLVRAE